MFTDETLQADIAKITHDVFETMLGMAVERIEAAQAPSDTKMMYTGLVTVSGSWSGAIMLACDAELARTIASMMFGTEASATTDAEINDAMGEMANMIGGNFKSMIPPPVTLSLPSVATGIKSVVRVPGCSEVGRYAFEFRAGEAQFTVCVLEHS